MRMSVDTMRLSQQHQQQNLVSTSSTDSIPIIQQQPDISPVNVYQNLPHHLQQDNLSQFPQQQSQQVPSLALPQLQQQQQNMQTQEQLQNHLYFLQGQLQYLKQQQQLQQQQQQQQQQQDQRNKQQQQYYQTHQLQQQMQQQPTHDLEQ